MNKEELLSQLNNSQRAAVEYNEGPQLVIAGAGSGKTRVLTYKIAYLLQGGMKPWNILALTFTNKAAREMKERIGSLVGEDVAHSLNMGTFHSVFFRILRQEAERIGYEPNFTIYDESDSRSLIKTIVKELNLDDKVYKPSSVHNRISMAKNHLISAAQYGADRGILERDASARLGEVWRIFAIYEQRCRQANSMDFDDLLVNTYRLLRDNEDLRRKYSDRFCYILVDEYQDTNYAQQQIVLLLTSLHQHVCVVGDDAQSIYAFRGANIDNILDFQKVFPKTRLFKLEQNYRSTQRIVQAANSLIKKNQRQIHKDVFSQNDEGDLLRLVKAYSDKEEASIVCKFIKRIRQNEHIDYADFAVLYRTNSQSRTFEEEMRRQGIPYRIYGGMSFYQRKEIKDIIAYFRVVVNPNDEEAIRRIINYPARGIGATTIEKLSLCAHDHHVSIWQVLCNPSLYSLQVNRGTLEKLGTFHSLISTFISKLNSSDACELGQEIIRRSGISADIFSSVDLEGVARQENLEEFSNALQEFVDTRREEDRAGETSLTDFLQEVSLLTDLDSDDDADSRVSLMTVHAAKGLEFSTVFIVGMEENIFPSPMSAESMRGLEEERRLFYVAITRAERHCIITCAKNRWRYGKLEFGTPSRFLCDIDPRLINIDDENVPSRYEDKNPYHLRSTSFGNSRMQNSHPVASQFRADPMPRITRPRQPEPPVNPFGPGMLRKLSEVRQDMSSHQAEPILKEGDVIEHQRFGIGTVIRVEGTGENAKATVEFRNLGTKQLLLKFAKYKRL